MTAPLTIGILSWKSPTTLKNTLESYRNKGLFEYPSQIFIYFQELSDTDREIAGEYGLPYFGSEHNLGIAGGYRAMLEKVQEPHYLFLENDWPIYPEPGIPAIGQLSQGIEFLNARISDVIRYRSRKNPGEPLWTLQFKDHELSRPEHLLDCIHWVSDPASKFPEQIKSPSSGWFTTSAGYANWTNNPHMYRTDWGRDVLLPHLGERDIEKDLQKWWQTTNYNVTQGAGLFTHQRL